MAKKKPEANETPAEAENTVDTGTEQLENELNESKESLLRLAAEYDNFRKRTQREKEQAYADTKAAVLKEFLPILDNFERAGNNTTDDFAAYKKGMDMTYAQLLSVLSALGTESFGEKGDAFDPAIHNAVMRCEGGDYPENTLAEVFSKGYKIGDKILRCADVQVAN